MVYFLTKFFWIVFVAYRTTEKKSQKWFEMELFKMLYGDKLLHLVQIPSYSYGVTDIYMCLKSR